MLFFELKKKVSTLFMQDIWNLFFWRICTISSVTFFFWLHLETIHQWVTPLVERAHIYYHWPWDGHSEHCEDVSLKHPQVCWYRRVENDAWTFIIKKIWVFFLNTFIFLVSGPVAQTKNLCWFFFARAKRLLSLKLTVCTWKQTLGKGDSYWGSHPFLFFFLAKMNGPWKRWVSGFKLWLLLVINSWNFWGG